LLFLAGSAGPDDVLFLTREQLSDLRVVSDDDEALVFRGWALHPYAGGATAVSTMANSRDKRERLIFSCRHDNPQQVLLTMSAKMAWEGGGVLSAADVRKAIFSSTLSADGVVIRKMDKDSAISELHKESDGWVYATTALSHLDFDQIMKAKTMRFELELPHVFDWRLGAETQMPPGLPYIELALRNCV
jgi:hypothetical protein